MYCNFSIAVVTKASHLMRQAAFLQGAQCLFSPLTGFQKHHRTRIRFRQRVAEHAVLFRCFVRPADECEAAFVGARLRKARRSEAPERKAIKFLILCFGVWRLFALASAFVGSVPCSKAGAELVARAKQRPSWRDVRWRGRARGCGNAKARRLVHNDSRIVARQAFQYRRTNASVDRAVFAREDGHECRGCARLSASCARVFAPLVVACAFARWPAQGAFCAVHEDGKDFAIPMAGEWALVNERGTETPGVVDASAIVRVINWCQERSDEAGRGATALKAGRPIVEPFFDLV